MSTTTATNPSAKVATPAPAARGRVTFLHLLRSEWIKLVTLRSTGWTLGLTLLGMVGVSVIFAASASAFASDTGIPLDGIGASAITFGYFIGQITVAVLGALAISGEYSTGMIRSTMAAAPRRLDVVAAKATVIGVVVFVTGILGTLLSYLVTLPLLPDGAGVSLGEGETWRVIAGTGAYLALIALLSFGIGAIVRNSAGAISAVLGVLLMLPLVFQILSGFGQDWATDVMTYLPGVAGERLMTVAGASEAMSTGMSTLSPTVGGLVLAGYVAVVLGIALTLVKKRDV
ncbi:ABC transporter permease subunit [Serinibacter arcticus]|uniref:ABC transporter, integral membrane subunit n=1 Tax=Serinibacter arcticus TaxID=1655435 RepID=A0A4Z1E310_9MICO|nr:ABC transporter permease subunit [Serinibacter arcticus]TGO04177.1 ABC transporter, integral membrane subunit [Serinibacter arcticus]